jgi:hypothetical protein
MNESNMSTKVYIVMRKQNTRAKEYRDGAEESDMHIDLEMRLANNRHEVGQKRC